MNFTDAQLKFNFYNSINYILSLNDPWNLVKNIANVLKHLEVISEINLKNELAFDWLNDEKKLKLIEIIIDYLKYSYESIKECIQKHNLIVKYETQSLIDCSGLVVNQHCKIYSLLQFSLLMWNWADKSVYFCIKFHDLNGLKILFKYINDSLLIFHLIERLKTQNLRRYEKAYFNLALSFKSIVGAVHNLSKFEQKYKQSWTDVNAFQNLFNLAKLFSDDKNRLSYLDIDLLGYFGLIYLVKNDADFLSLSEIDKYIYKVIDLLEECGTQMATRNYVLIERKYFKLNENNEAKEIAIVRSKENTQWRLTELIEFLVRVCDLSDKFKNDTFENFTSLQLSIKQILFNGNENEKESILKLVWKLSFNSDLTRKFVNDIDLCSFIIGLTCNKFVKNKNLIKYCDLIIFLFDNLDTNINSNKNKTITNDKSINIVRVDTTKSSSFTTKTSKVYF